MQKFTRAGACLPTISAEAWNAIASYPFPGNVRELAHAVEHAMVLAGDREVELIHLPSAVAFTARHLERADGPPLTNVRPLRLALRDFERAYLQRAVELCDGGRSRAAEALGISRKTLWQKLRHAPSEGDPPSSSAAIAGQI
jgi:DNA-binding NtrC family response regulator